jgi:phosphoglycolate phosphatase-like HAD superfamily hydrolase
MKALILDCDGTLVRINRSYNACIIETTRRMLRSITGEEWSNYADEDMILAFRMSGGFNNDVDTCYALILAGVAAHTRGLDPRNLVYDLAANADSRGIVSVEDYLVSNGMYDVVGKVREYTGYPGLVGSSTLATLFDELFYGRDLFVKMHGIEPRFIDASRGFIEYDEVIINKSTLERLKSRFYDRITIVSGRSRISAEYTLKELLGYFNLNASVFIEDEDKYVKRNGLDIIVTKPNPYALLKSLDILGAREAIVVGDSMEDLIMARSVGDRYKTVFVGVYGTSIDAERQREAFIKHNSDFVIENVNMLPGILECISNP